MRVGRVSTSEPTAVMTRGFDDVLWGSSAPGDAAGGAAGSAQSTTSSTGSRKSARNVVRIAVVYFGTQPGGGKRQAVRDNRGSARRDAPIRVADQHRRKKWLPATPGTST